MDIATIEDLNVDLKAPLNQDTKKALVKLLEDEFGSKNTLYHEIREHEENKIMEAYRKSVTFEKLLRDIDKAEIALHRAQEKLDLVGLDPNGSIKSYHRGGWNNESKHKSAGERASEKVREKLAQIAKNAPSYTLRSKIIARLHLSRTYGEAMVIVREVLGNGIIPSISKADVKLLT